MSNPLCDRPSVRQVIDVNKIPDRVQGRDVSMCKCVCEYVCAYVSVHVHVIVRLCLFVSDDVDDVDDLLEDDIRFARLLFLITCHHADDSLKPRSPLTQPCVRQTLIRAVSLRKHRRSAGLGNLFWSGAELAAGGSRHALKRTVDPFSFTAKVPVCRSPTVFTADV